MKSLVLIALLFCGCTTLQPPEAPDTLPELIYQVPLPPWPTTAYVQGSTLELMLRVTSDGSVHSAHLLTPSGYTDWDSLALEVVRQWRFSPARMGTRPVPCWIQQKVRVRFEPPEPITLAELVCPDRLLVDSLHALIVEGASFDSLARIYSVAASRDKGGFLGEIDARSFPAHVRQRLTALRVDDITSPLIVGRNVAIFKRLRRIP